MDQAVSEIQNITLETVTQVVTPCKKKQINRNQKNKIPWFKDERHAMKSRLSQARVMLKARPYERNVIDKYIHTRKLCKRCTRKAEKQYKDEMTNKLLEIENQDPKAFWKLIDNMRKWGETSKDSTDTIHQSKWHNHFPKLLNNNSGKCIAKDQQKLLDELEKKPCFSRSDFRICEEELT